MIIICVTVSTLLLLSFLFCILANRTVIHEAQLSTLYKCGSEADVEGKYDAIVVLGAGLKSDGTPSHMLEDRLKAAIAMYREGVSQTIMLSGDNSGEDYNEVAAMERYCLDANIPSEAIVLDGEGFSTYETMHNAINENKYAKVMVVTQKYHLYRAVYIAREMGAEADGYCADYRAYFGQIRRDLREYLARTKDFVLISTKKTTVD